MVELNLRQYASEQGALGMRVEAKRLYMSAAELARERLYKPMVTLALVLLDGAKRGWGGVGWEGVVVDFIHGTAGQHTTYEHLIPG